MIRAIARQEILRLGESQTVEIKKSLSHTREGLQALAAMVNAETAKGLLLFGVGPDGVPVGIEAGNLDTAQKSLAQRIHRGFKPALMVSIELWNCDGLTLVAVQASRDRGVPYHEYEGSVYIREGSTKRRLTDEEKDRLKKRRDRDLHPGPWKCDRCGSLVGLLLSVVVSDEGTARSYVCECGGEYWPVA